MMKMLGQFAANIIWILHALFILWYVLTPFTNSEPMLVLHFFTGPFLLFHWVVNDDSCSLTLLEMKLRGIEDCKQSFFWNLVSPIYKPQTSETGSQIMWLLTTGIWFVTLVKVLRKPEMVGNMFRDARRVISAEGGPTRE
jgi:hypothetical protein